MTHTPQGTSQSLSDESNHKITAQVNPGEGSWSWSLVTCNMHIHYDHPESSTPHRLHHRSSLLSPESSVIKSSTMNATKAFQVAHSKPDLIFFLRVFVLLILGVATIDASHGLPTQRCAFQSPHHNSLVVAVAAYRRTTITTTRRSTSHHLSAAGSPGMSDERRKEERDAEIRSTIAKLKREGKTCWRLKHFFHQPSPVRKFQEKYAERKRITSLLLPVEEAANKKKGGDDVVKHQLLTVVS